MKRTALAVVLVLGGLLAACQNSFLYFPQRYLLSPTALPAPMEALSFETGEGRQYTVWIPSRSGRAAHVWLVFGGNAMAALSWVEWLKDYPDEDTGFLLIEYPGYGWNEGRPSAESILESTEAAVATLAARLGEPGDSLGARLCVLGHSVGGSAALTYAAKHRPACLLLSASFTRLDDVATRLYGGWTRLFIRGHDNVARLAELDARPPVVRAFHGTADEIIPVSQGRALAARFPWLRLTEIEGAKHNDLLRLARERMQGAMHEMGLAAPAPQG